MVWGEKFVTQDFQGIQIASRVKTPERPSPLFKGSETIHGCGPSVI